MIVSVLAGLASIISLSSTKLVVTPLGPPRAATPFEALFELDNQSVFAVKDVVAETVCDGRIGGWEFREDQIPIQPKFIQRIDAGSKPITYTAPMFYMTRQGPRDWMAMTVKMRYRASWTFWRQTLIRRFFTLHTPSGEMRWIEIPLEQALPTPSMKFDDGLDR